MSPFPLRSHASICRTCGICVNQCPSQGLQMVESPCRQASPLSLNYQEIMHLLLMEDEEGAARALRHSTDLGGLCATLTDPFAEKACRQEHDGHSLPLSQLCRHLTISQPGIVYGQLVLPESSGRRVAIVGSGPAGMQAACTVRRGGHDVTLFEAAPQAGVTFLHSPVQESSSAAAEALPPVPEDALLKTLFMLEAMGIVIVTSAPKGQSDLETLCREYDAVICACGKGAVLPARDDGRVDENLFAAGTCVKNRKGLGALQAMDAGRHVAYTVRSMLGDEGNLAFKDSILEILPVQKERMPGSIQPSRLSPEEIRSLTSTCQGCGYVQKVNEACGSCRICVDVCPSQAWKV